MIQNRHATPTVARIHLSGPLTGKVLLRQLQPLVDACFDVDHVDDAVVIKCDATARLRPTGTGVLFRTVLDLFARGTLRLLVVIGAPEPLRMTLDGLFRQIDACRRTFFVPSDAAAQAVLRLHALPSSHRAPLLPPPADLSRLPALAPVTVAA